MAASGSAYQPGKMGLPEVWVDCVAAVVWVDFAAGVLCAVTAVWAKVAARLRIVKTRKSMPFLMERNLGIKIVDEAL